MLQSTFRQIEVFLEVVRTGSFARTAESLSISGASVSNHIKALEKQMGAALFHRTRGKRATLTEAGHRVHLRGTELMKQAELLARELKPNRDTRRRRLVIIAQRFMARTFLPDPVTLFTERHPEIELIVETGTFDDVIAAVSNDVADLGFAITYEGGVLPASTIVGQERLGFFAAPDHAAVRSGPHAIAALKTWPFLLTRKDERFAHLIEVSMAQRGLSGVHVAAQLQDGAMISEVTSRSDCLMCGPFGSVQEMIANGKLAEVPLTEAPIVLPIHQIVAPGTKAAREIAAFAEVLSGVSG